MGIIKLYIFAQNLTALTFSLCAVKSVAYNFLSLREDYCYNLKEILYIINFITLKCFKFIMYKSPLKKTVLRDDQKHSHSSLLLEKN